MGINLNRMIDQVAKEKGIARDTLVEALEAALVSAATKEIRQSGRARGTV